MKKHFLKIVIGLFVALILAIVVVLYKIDSIIEKKIRTVAQIHLEPKGYVLNFSNVSLALGFPLKLKMENISLEEGSHTKINIERIEVTIAMVDGYLKTTNLFPDLEITVINPKIVKLIQEEKAPPKPQATPNLPFQSLEHVASEIPLIKNLKLLLKVENLVAEINEPFAKLASIKNTNVELSFQSLQSPINLSFSAFIKSEKSPLPIWIPLELKSQWQMREGMLTLSQSDMRILAVATKSRGQIDLNRRKMAIQVLAQIPALEKLPLPVNLELPFSSWKGSLDSKINVVGPFSQLNYEGFLSLKNALIQLQFKNDTTQAQGPLVASLQTEFQSAPQLNIKNAAVDLDLSQVDFTYGRLLKKPKDIPLLIKTQLRYNQTLTIDTFSMKFAQLDATGSGSMTLTDPKTTPAQLSFEIPPTNLSGLEKFLLPLSQYPMTGSLAVKASINGDLKNASQSRINISNLSIKNLSTQVKYATNDMILEGPITLNLESKLFVDRLSVNSGSAQLISNLSGLKIKYKDMFLKSANDPLSISLNAVQKNRSLLFKASHAQTPAGTINFSGTPPISMASPMNITVDSKSLELARLRAWLPSLQKQIPNGNANFTSTLSGRFDTENFFKSPMNINIRMTAQIPRYAMPKAPAQPPALRGVPVKANLESFLPNEPLIKQLRGNFNLNIGEFEMDALRAEQITIQSQLNSGTLQASANIKKVFEGEAKAKSIKLNLIQPDPLIQFDVQSPNLHIEKALAWSLPQFEKALSGKTNLQVQGMSKLPSSPDFMQKLSATGNFKIENGYLNVATFADMAKGLTEKIPGFVMDKVANQGPVPIKMLGNFQIKNSQVSLTPFQAVTPKREELYIKGLLGLDMKVNMSGILYLVNVGSGSFFEANKDRQGRLEIPLQVQGSLLKPEFKFAEETISRMTQKTLQFEKTKLVNKGKEKAKQEIDRQKDKLQDALKDKLKDVFK